MLETLDPYTQDAEGLQNISDKGKAPPSRLADYKSAADIVKHLIREDEEDKIDRINEQALLDGQGPFIQAELDAAGQGWRQNNNWGGATAKFEEALAPYHDLLNGFTAELEWDAVQGPAREEYQSIIAEAWQYLHTRIWSTHAFQNHNLYRLFVGFGIGVADHEHPLDWRWRAGGMGEHYFPRPMQAYEDATHIHVRVREFNESELWNWYNRKKAEEAGFNLEEVRKAMIACNSSNPNKSDYWNSLTNNIYGATYSRKSSVRLFTMRVVEMTDDGEMVSECIGRADGGGDGFLYKSKKPVWQDSMADCFTLFLAGIGNGDLHSIKGLARKVFAPSQTENQFINQMFDFARIWMSPMFKSDSANAAQLLSTMQIGLFNLIPRGLELIPATASPDYSKSLVPLLGFANQIGQQNSGIFQQNPSASSVEKTREEIIQNAQQNAVLTSSAITLFSMAKERQYNTSLKRLLRPNYSSKDPGYREREAFIKRCTDRGVPREVVLKTAFIKPNRQVGGGSAAVGQMLLKQAHQSLRPFLNPSSQQALDEMLAIRMLGADTAKVLIPKLGIVTTTEEQRFAQFENRLFKMAQSFPPNPDDDHFLHASTHNQMIVVMTQQAAQAGAVGQTSFDPSQPNPADAAFLGFLNAIIPHQNAHLQTLGQAGPDPRQEVINSFKLTLNKAQQDQEHLTNKAQRQQNILAQQAQAEQQRQADLQRKGATAPDAGVDSGKLQQRALEAQQELTFAAQKHQQDLAQSAEKHQQALAQLAQRQSLENQGRDAKRAADILDKDPTPPVPPVSPTSVYPPPGPLTQQP